MTHSFDPGERLRRAAAEALDRARLLETELGARTGPPRPGDLFMLSDGAEQVLQWAVVLHHPDRPELLYVIPADYFPMTGTVDVGVDEDSPAGPLALRCGLGFWAHAESFASATLTGVLDKDAIQDASDRIADLATGMLDDTSPASDADDDPEYEDHIAHLAEVVERVSIKLNSVRRPWSGDQLRKLAALAACLLMAVTAIIMISNRRGAAPRNGAEAPVVVIKPASPPRRTIDELKTKVDLELSFTAGATPAPLVTSPSSTDGEPLYLIPNRDVIKLILRPERPGLFVVVRVLRSKCGKFSRAKSTPVMSLIKPTTDSLRTSTWAS